MALEANSRRRYIIDPHQGSTVLFGLLWLRLQIVPHMSCVLDYRFEGQILSPPRLSQFQIIYQTDCQLNEGCVFGRGVKIDVIPEKQKCKFIKFTDRVREKDETGIFLPSKKY